MPPSLRLAVLIGLLTATGCGPPDAPLTAGGHPVAYWLAELGKPDAKARAKAVKELGRVGPADPAAIPAVTGALKDRDAGVRKAAVLALLNLGPAAVEALPVLVEASTKDADPAVRSHAAKAVERVRGARPEPSGR